MADISLQNSGLTPTNNRSSNVTQSFRDQKQIETFIRSNKVLKIVEGAADNYVKTFELTKRPEDALAAIIVVIPFDYNDLLSQPLLHFAIEEPLQFIDATKYCIFSLIRDFIKRSPDSGLKAIDIAQVHVLLRFLGLPLQKSLTFDPSQSLFPTGLCILVGILSAVTEIKEFVLQSVWYCATGCQRNKIKSDSLDVPLCTNCSHQMNEYTKLRSTQKYRLLRVLPASCVQTPRLLNKIFRAITVRVRDSIENEAFNLNDTIASCSESAPYSFMRFSDRAVVVKSEKLDQSDNDHELEKFEEEFPKISDSDLDEIEQLERLRNSFNNKSPIENNQNLSSQNNLIKEETLGFSFNKSENEVTFPRELADAELPNLDFDFELLDEVERAHTSHQAAVAMDATQIKAFNSAIAEAIPLSNTSLVSQSANPMDFLSLRYGNPTAQNINNEQQSNLCINSDVMGGTHNHVSSQPLDYSRNKEAIEQETTINRVVQQPHLNVINDSVADASLIPLSVKQLYDVIKSEYSDFAFVYAISAQLCQNRVPMDCFVNLKMGLLLSLTSIGQNPDIPPIPIIAIGNDAYMTNFLMDNIGQLADRFIGPAFDIKPPSNVGDKDHVWIEADPIILAKGGVYYVGDWSILRPARVDKLFKVVECSGVPIEKTTYVFPLETAIWAHWRSFKNNAKEQHVFNNFIKVFGIPIIVEDDNHEVLVDYILQQSSIRIFESTIDHLSISEEDMRSFLAVISKRTVDHTKEAMAILQKYFVASRIERPDCLSKQAFVMLKQFAESFAKLSLRQDVLEIDAVAAIFMCENYVQNIFGASDNPPPKFESHNYVGNVHAHLKQFKKWLRKYIERYHDKP